MNALLVDVLLAGLGLDSVHPCYAVRFIFHSLVEPVVELMLIDLYLLYCMRQFAYNRRLLLAGHYYKRARARRAEGKTEWHSIA